jgi:hydroxyacylglutathione hydrolase
MILQKLVVTELETNCYVLSRDGKGAMIVDPGGEPERIVAWLNDNKLVPEWIVCTHGHADHLGANKFLKDTFPHLRIAIGVLDAPCLVSAIKNMSVLMGYWVKSPAADLKLNDGDRFTFQDLEFEVILVPGHTPGGICLFTRWPGNEDESVLFSGDVLFSGAIGRSDIPGGNAAVLVKTIRERLLTLPGQTVVYPGHGRATTIDIETKRNPWV